MVVVDTIKFDSSFSGNQKLVLAFDNVQSVAFRGLHVDEALEVSLIFSGLLIIQIVEDELSTSTNLIIYLPVQQEKKYLPSYIKTLGVIHIKLIYLPLNPLNLPRSTGS